MANRERGEIAVTTFDGVEYTIAPCFNALCEVKDRFGAKVSEILLLCQDGDPLAIRAFLWVLLQKFHAADFQTFESVGAWIDTIPGGADRVLGESFAANRDAGAELANPPKAQTGTGEGSSLLLSVSA